MILSKLGIKQVQAIMKAKNPWADLKAAASKPGIMFRLVTQDEQRSYVAERAKMKHGAQVTHHKSKKISVGITWVSLPH